MRTVLMILAIAFFSLNCGSDYQSNVDHATGEENQTMNQSQVIIDSGNIEFGNIIASQDAVKYIKNYRRNYMSGGRKMTNAVWFSKDFIRYVYSQLESDLNVDGVRIYLGAYDTPPSEVQVEHPNQISLFWIATRPDGENHRNDTSFFKVPMTFDVLNHGKLCPPQICDSFE